MYYAVNVPEARDCASTIRLSCKDLENVASDLGDVAKDIDEHNDDFMSTHEIGGNIDLAAQAIRTVKDHLETVAKALDDLADTTATHENKILNTIHAKTK